MRLAAWLGAVALLVAPRAARAESAAELFEDGLAAFLAGNPAVGCPKLEKSYAAEPLPGVLFTLAECQSAWGKLHTAHGSYLRFLEETRTLPKGEQAKHRERRAVAERKAEALAESVPKLSIGVRGEVPRGARVLLDGRDVTADLGKALPVNPGRHEASLVVDGDVVSRKTVALAERGKLAIELSPGESSDTNAAPTAPDPEPERDTGGTSAGVYVLGGLGLAGVAVGTVAGLMTLSRKSSVEDNCPNRTCNAEGREAIDSAQSLGAVSTIGFGVGAAALLGAAVLHFTAGPRAEQQARGFTLGPSRRGAALRYRGVF
jgi:hypothetical protein